MTKRHTWLDLPIGGTAVVPEYQYCRHEVCRRAHQARKRTGKQYRCTRTDGGTLVERVA